MELNKSYAGFIKQWRENPISNIEGYLQLIQEMNFIEDTELEYNKLPLQTKYLVLPIVSVDSLATVKIAYIHQADNFALIVPDKVYESYKKLEKDASEETLVAINSEIELSIDSLGFTTTDNSFIELVKQVYLDCNNAEQAFNLTIDGQIKADEQEDEEEEEENFGSDSSPFAGEEPITDKPKRDSFKFDSPSIEIADTLEKEEAVYSQFSARTKALKKLENKLSKQPAVLTKNTYVKYLGENKNALAIIVDNKNIYNSLAAVPKKAKEVISLFGEAIRNNKDTQIVDSFIIDNQRVFIITENTHSNFWIVENETIEELDKATKSSKTIIVPTKYITLPKSSVRKESRKAVPVLKEDKVAFQIIN